MLSHDLIGLFELIVAIGALGILWIVLNRKP